MKKGWFGKIFTGTVAAVFAFSFIIPAVAIEGGIRNPERDRIFRVIDNGNTQEYTYVQTSKSSSPKSPARSVAGQERVNIKPKKNSFIDLSHPYAKDEIIIKLASGSEDLVKSIFDTISVVGVENLGERRLRVRINSAEIREKILEQRAKLRQNYDDFDDAKLFESVLKSLNELKFVEYAEPNYIAKALYIPNDRYYKYQWSFKMIGMEKAWDMSQGEGVVIAVLDSGVAYENWSVYKKAPNLSQTSFVKPFNVLENTTHANDDNGHGTHIAGIIAATTGDRNGTAGMAYKASIMPIKVLDRAGYGTYADIAEGIIKAVDQGADIINLSLGGPADSKVLYDAVKYAYDNNVLVVAASGNDGEEGLYYPAAYSDYVLSVGAVDIEKDRAYYSNFGKNLEVMAPGGDLKYDKNKDGQKDGILQQTLRQFFGFANTRSFKYYLYEGTSVAAPHVAALAALIKARGIDDINEIERIIKDTAEDLQSAGWDKYTGYGLIRADKALEYVESLSEAPVADGQNQSPDNEGSNSPSESSRDQNQNQNNSPDNNSQDTDSNPDPNQDNSTSDNSGEGSQGTPSGTAPDPAQENSQTADQPQLKNIDLKAATYNIWGRLTDVFEFWEPAYIGIFVKDDKGNKLEKADIEVKVYDKKDRLVAQGSGTSDKEGELWLKLGNFAKGVYKAVITASLAGYNSTQTDIKFTFKGLTFGRR